MEGIFPGCYFDISRNINAPNASGVGSKRILIIGVHSFVGSCYDNYNHGSVTRIWKNHIVCMPFRTFGNSRMADSNSSGYFAYYDSYMNQQVIGLPTTTGNISGTINEQLYAEFGNHLMTYYQHLPIEYTDETTQTKRIKNDWRFVQAIIPSEIEVLGSHVLSPTGYNALGTGSNNRTFPAFIYNNLNISNGDSYWFRDRINNDRTSYSHIPYYDYRGYSEANDGKSNAIACRPYFLLG